MHATATSPRITRIAWGRIEIEQQGAFKDAKVYPGGAREWDWQETGTHHTPGIQPDDVAELLEHGAEVVILSRGMLRQLQVCRKTLEQLRRQGVETHVLETRRAVELYNELRTERAVAGLFHSTC